MKKALVPHEDGVAIAASQIGVLLRIFVVSGKVFDIEALKDDDEESAPSKKSGTRISFLSILTLPKLQSKKSG